MAVVLTWPNTGLCGECLHDKDKVLSMFRANVVAPQSKGRAVKTNRTWGPKQFVICPTVCVCVCVCVPHTCSRTYGSVVLVSEQNEPK